MEEIINFTKDFRGRRISEDLDAPYPIREGANVTHESRFRPRARKRLTKKNWRESFDSKGTLVGLKDVIKRIQRGGIEPTIRNQVWEFLLGLFPTDSTEQERKEIRAKRSQIYDSLFSECQKMDPVIGTGEIVEYPRINEDGTPVSPPGSKLSGSVIGTRNGETQAIESGEQYSNEAADKSEESSEPKSESDSESGNDTDGKQRSETEAQEESEPEQKEQSNEELGAQLPVTQPEVEAEAEPKEEPEGEAGANLSQSEKAIKWRLTLHQIGVDVLRTDGTLEFFRKGENLSRLMDLLAVYSWFDPDVGYCQGMSDLLAPFVVVYASNSDAFWGFERLMRRIRSNFKGDRRSIGVQRQLDSLALILETMDLKLYQHFESIGASNFFFLIRTLLVLFRRELSFADSMYMLEMIWAFEFDEDEANFLSKFLDMQRQTPKKPKMPFSLGRRTLGKFRKQSVRKPTPFDDSIVTFCVAAILIRSRANYLSMTGLDQITNEYNDSVKVLDPKLTCKQAVELHFKFLNKVRKAR